MILQKSSFLLKLEYANFISDYPHTNMTFMFKFFYIVQIAYWLHVYPELYFQKVKREDMAPKIQYATLYLIFIGAAYLFSYTKIALFLMVLHYAVEAIFHAGNLDLCSTYSVSHLVVNMKLLLLRGIFRLHL